MENGRITPNVPDNEKRQRKRTTENEPTLQKWKTTVFVVCDIQSQVVLTLSAH